MSSILSESLSAAWNTEKKTCIHDLLILIKPSDRHGFQFGHKHFRIIDTSDKKRTTPVYEIAKHVGDVAPRVWLYQYSVALLWWFLGYLAKSKADLCKNPGKAQVNRPTLLRSLFTLGLLCKQFDFDSDVKPKNEVSSMYSNYINLTVTMPLSNLNKTLVWYV